MGALEAICWQLGPPASLKLLDQRLLPLESVYLDIDGPKAAFTAIKVTTFWSLINRQSAYLRLPMRALKKLEAMLHQKFDKGDSNWTFGIWEHTFELLSCFRTWQCEGPQLLPSRLLWRWLWSWSTREEEHNLNLHRQRLTTSPNSCSIW